MLDSTTKSNNKSNKNKLITTGSSAASAAVASIFTAVIMTEGGYVNHPKDPGGETNYGITKNVATANGYYGSMANLQKDQALDIYVKQYYEKPNFNKIMPLSFAVTEKISDAGVNVGTSRPAKWLQESLNLYSNNCTSYSCITVDGKIGEATVKAYNSLIKKRGNVGACKLILKALDNKQFNHYERLNKSMAVFFDGWIANRIQNVSLDECDKKGII